MDGAAPSEAGAPAAASTAIVFVKDHDSEGVIRQCLSDLAVVATEFKKGGILEAIADLATRPSPHLLIVDISGIDDPVGPIRELANVCDPTTGVVVIGQSNDIRLYRDLKAVGVVEYFFKPLVRALVMRSCNGILTGSTAQPSSRTGKLIFVVGARGGAGATTVAVACCWHLAEIKKRRVCLLDLDLQFGDAALQLNASPSHALIEALEHPDRVDDLFLDRATARIGERLGVLASLETLDQSFVPDEPAVLLVLEQLLKRSRYVFVDVPLISVPHLMQALHLPSTILLVSSGSLVSARDVGRLRKKLGANSAERIVIHVLNERGAAESLSEAEFARAAGTPPDIIIQYSRKIAVASRLGVQGLQDCPELQSALLPLYQQLSGEEDAPPRWRLRDLFR